MDKRTSMLGTDPHILTIRCQPFRRLPWRRSALLSLGLMLFLAANSQPAFSQRTSTPRKFSSHSISGVKFVIGLENLKQGAKGTITSAHGGLEFSSGKASAKIPSSSIQDIFTGEESRQDVGGMKGAIVESVIPYGGGRVVSLFSHRVDVLTVEYVDSSGGFHGAIFVLPAGRAAMFRDELVAQGAKAFLHTEAPKPGEQKQ